MATYMTDDLVPRWSTFTTDDNLNPDTFIVFQDVDKAHSDMIDRYYILKNKTFTTDAEKAEMTSLAVGLQEYLPTSDTWNKLCACVRGMQMYMRDGIVIFVEQKQAEINEIISNYSEKGIWDKDTNYKTGNLVKHGEFLFLSKVDNNLNHEPNNEVLSDTYWMRFLIKGDKGDPSLNISIKKGTDGSANYDNTITYNTGDACVYNNRLYYAKVDGVIGINPSDNTKWACAEKIWIGTTEPLDHFVIWWDTNVGQNCLKRYSDNNEWMAETIKADNVVLVDSGNYYTIKNVESALQQNGLKLSKFGEDANSKLTYNGVKVGATNANEINLSPISGMTSSNVQTGMLELFTFANSGKTGIASTVGNLTSSNTFSQIQNEIQTDKNILATNLVNKGVSANGTDSLRNLANLVVNITGKKSGSTTSVNNYLNINLGFVPSLFLAKSSSSQNQYVYCPFLGFNSICIEPYHFNLSWYNIISYGSFITINGTNITVQVNTNNTTWDWVAYQ